MKLIIELRDYQQKILADIYDSLFRGNRRPLVTAPCGSGKTKIFVRLAELTQNKGNSVIVLVHRRELFNQTIKTFQSDQIDLDLISVHMAQTYSRHLDKYDQPSLIITDEAHMSQAATWRRIFDHWPDSFVVGFSASPCRLDGKPLGEIYDDLIIGPSTADLIRDGWLSPYRYYSVDVADLAGLKRKGADYDQQDAETRMNQRAVYGDIVRTLRERAPDARTVAYCTTINHSIRTAEELRTAGFKAEHIDGTVSEKQRDGIIDRFRSGEIQILTNCDIVSTGFDLPDISCCMMLRPTMSTALFIQQSGRALRFQDGKTAVILDFVGNYMRHGLPDDDREWSLTEPIRRKQPLNQDGSFAIRSCPRCYAVFPSSVPVCPVCGQKYYAGREEIAQIEAVELKRIEKRRKESQAEKDRKRKLELREEIDCRCYRDLLIWAEVIGLSGKRKIGFARSKAIQNGWWVPGKR